MLAVFVLLSAIRSCTVLRVPKMNSRCQHVASYSNHRLNSSMSLYTENIHLFTWILMLVFMSKCKIRHRPKLPEAVENFYSRM